MAAIPQRHHHHHSNNNKGPYKKPKRDVAKREIRRLIIDEGLTNKQISEQLHIPQRTVERYISQLYEHDNELLAGLNSDEEMLRAHNICKERMTHYRQEITENIARNKNAPFKDQLAAWHLICELEAADLRLLNNAVLLRSTIFVHELIEFINNLGVVVVRYILNL